jgi:hypothetical protein
MSQRALSAAGGGDLNHVHRIESGEVQDPASGAISEFVKALRCNADVLMRDCSSYWAHVDAFSTSALRAELQATDEELIELKLWPPPSYLANGVLPSHLAMARVLEAVRELRRNGNI